MTSIIKPISINGMELEFYDHPGSIVCAEMQDELNQGCYGLESVNFEEGDVVVDIGANVGVVSIYLAKKFPFLKIYSYEPIPGNFENFKKNIEVNGVENVKAFQFAVTNDSRDLSMQIHAASNSGGATSCLKDGNLEGHDRFTVKSTTIDDIFDENEINVCKLLKIDCEGSEHEILLNSEKLSCVETLAGEFHINSFLSERGYSNEKLEDYCKKFVDGDKMFIKSVSMADY